MFNHFLNHDIPIFYIDIEQRGIDLKLDVSNNSTNIPNNQPMYLPMSQHKVRGIPTSKIQFHQFNISTPKLSLQLGTKGFIYRSK